jgi:hypothetical protein
MDAEHGFDFLEGEWDADCRVPTAEGWQVAPGSLSVTRTLGGRLFVERFEGIYHGGPIQGLGLRAYDRDAGEWVHTWADTLEPARFHVWRGSFRGGEIALFGEWTEPDGRAVRSRLAWSRITGDTAHWESARSLDGGRTWEAHWVIDWRRRGRRAQPRAAASAGWRR